MKPLKSYLLRAYYEWICDSDCTPHILVQADFPHVKVPEKYIDEDDQIVLNIAPSATDRMRIHQFYFQFDARFDATVHDIIVPYYAVIGLYAEENDEGIYFELSEDEFDAAEADFLSELSKTKVPSSAQSPQKKPTSHAHLRVVRNEE